MPSPVITTHACVVLLAALSMVATVRAEMAWDPFINECMETGKHRAECFELLPPDLLAELEAYEAEQRRIRQEQVRIRQALNPPSGPVFGQARGARGQAPQKPRHTAVVLLHPTRFDVALPTTVTEPFVLQLFEAEEVGHGQVVRLMRGATEVTGAAAEGTVVTMERPYGEAFYLHSDELREDYYVRLIRTRSLTYRDYKPTLADYRPDGTIYLDGYVASHVDFDSFVTDSEQSIAQSPPISLNIVRRNAADTPRYPDYSHNMGFVEGLPASASRPQPLTTPFGWHYAISGIWFTESGSERYLFRRYGLDENGMPVDTGYRSFDIADLKAHNFVIDEVDHAGE